MRYILTGGGTGGHIFSAIATANELKKIDSSAEIIFVGSKYYMEMDLVPQSGYSIIGMPVRRWNRFSWWKNYKFPFELLWSLKRSYQLIKNFKPDAVIGTGGFATGPILKMAQWMNVPNFIQEHNAYPGITTRLLSKKASKIHIAFERLGDFIKLENSLLTGNPVREDIVKHLYSSQEAKTKLGFDPNKPLLVIIGGSRGAARINEIIFDLWPDFNQMNLQVYLQTGKELYSPYKTINENGLRIVPFITDIPLAMAAADIIISRAGAMTISELAIIGKPGILVPDTFSEQGHQDYNAETLARKNAAIYIKENELSAKLFPIITKLVEHPEEANKLAQNIKKFAFPRASKMIAEDIYNSIKKA